MVDIPFMVSELTPQLTPMMKQYVEIKRSYEDCILFFRLGDFYEMFFEDALEASSILKITLTSRSRTEEDKIPMCGIPFHSSESYIQKLLDHGKKVAICEQVSDPQDSKGLVERKVIRVVTPSLTLQGEAQNYLASIVPQEETLFKTYALSYLNLATGECRATVLTSRQALRDELYRVRPKELLWPLELKDNTLLKILQKLFPNLLVNFIPSHSEGRRPEESPDNSQKSVEALFWYLKKYHYENCAHIQKVETYETGKTLQLDLSTIRNLELLTTSYTQSYEGSLLWLLDHTKTAMGKRLLKQWLLYPLLEVSKIKDRQERVEELVEKASLRDELRKLLSEILDLERVIGRLTLASGNARDLAALRNALSLLPRFNELLSEPLPEFSVLTNLLKRALVDAPPLAIKEGGMIAEGYHSELDELIRLCRDGKSTIAELEAKEKKRTGISSLKIRFNQVFGYYIDITKTHLDSIPSDYIRKQTLVNSERYITPELKDYEHKILTAEERRKKLEYEIFEGLRVQVLKELSLILEMCHRLSTLDVLCSLAEVASQNHYEKPNISQDFTIDIQEGRHPVIEKMGNTRFVPNSIRLDLEQRLLIITGPNMAGKSTVMRQVALITLMAQMGSFVPAESAQIGVVDRIFTRVGAHDNVAFGESTFMVEMKETAQILKSATSKSLILLDEIGRGTSTFDGLSIAWAVASQIHDEIRAKTLFATHYHELTALVHEKAQARNFHIAIREAEGEIVFIRKLLPGSIRRSYGVEVARLAGLPDSVIDKAKEILKNLEKGELVGGWGGARRGAHLDEASGVPRGDG